MESGTAGVQSKHVTHRALVSYDASSSDLQRVSHLSLTNNCFPLSKFWAKHSLLQSANRVTHLPFICKVSPIVSIKDAQGSRPICHRMGDSIN